MGSVDLSIEAFEIEADSADGEERRMKAITEEAIAALRELLEERVAGWGDAIETVRLDALAVPAIAADLRLMGDEEVARRVADATLHAIARRLGVEPAV